MNVIDRRELERLFEYHPPKDDQPIRYATIRGMMKTTAERVANLTPPSHEQRLANAAIARNE